MNIKWFGHSCFVLTSETGIRVLMDPVDPETGYDLQSIKADAVTISHDHHDHNYLPAVAGNPAIIRETGAFDVGPVHIEGIHSWHDEAEGQKRGNNILYVVEMDGIRILHAGDLGHLPNDSTIGRLHRIDVLLVPIGGVYTIDYVQALALANMIRPKVVIPMHYRTKNVTFKLGELAPFLNKSENCGIQMLRQSDATLTKETLGSDRIIVLEYDAVKR